jgi:hypothetical protein
MTPSGKVARQFVSIKLLADFSLGVLAVIDVESQGPQVAERKFDNGGDQEDQRPEIAEQRKPRLPPNEIEHDCDKHAERQGEDLHEPVSEGRANGLYGPALWIGKDGVLHKIALAANTAPHLPPSRREVERRKDKKPRRKLRAERAHGG